MRLFRLRVFTLSILMTATAYGQSQCASGNPDQTNIVQQLAKATQNNTFTQLIYRLYKLGPRTEAGGYSSCAESSSRVGHLLPIEIVKIPRAPQMLFRTECMIESNKFKAEPAQITCPDGKKSKDADLCITEDFLKYENAVISNFVGCAMKEDLGGIEPEYLYQMYSLESAFKPQLVHKGGVGLGQLTNVFIDDVHQKHRGFKFLEKIANSKKPECQAAKIIAKKDLIIKPNLNFACSFASVGEGLERNILYSLIGLAVSWENDIEPPLRSYLKTHAKSPYIREVMNLSLLNSYGAGGLAGARAAIKRLKGHSPADFVKSMRSPLLTKEGQNLTTYTSSIDSRQKQIKDLLPVSIKTEFEKTGVRACVNHY